MVTTELTATRDRGAPGDALNAVEAGDARFVRRKISVEMAAVAAADFDNDGNLDLVSAGDPQLTILRGNGNGHLTSVSHVPGGKNPVDVALADLDEDGDIDIVVANHDTDYLTILLGDGRGAFQPSAASPLGIPVRPHPHAVRAADLDADGHVDLIVDHREARGLLFLKGLGNGGFETPGTIASVGGDPYRGMAVGDINRDGLADLVTPNPGAVAVLLNASREGLSLDLASPVAAEAPFAVELGDFNGDGRLDLIAASDEGSPLVEVYLGDGLGGFQGEDSARFLLAPGAKKVVVGDFNGDGVEDAAASSYQSSIVLVLFGGRKRIRMGTLLGDESPGGLAAADLNGDGKDDLVIADDTTHRAMIYLSAGPWMRAA